MSILQRLAVISLIFGAPAFSQESVIIKPADIARARENLARHAWAKQHLESLQKNVEHWMGKISPEFLHNFIPDTTPGGDILPCPSCRDLGKTFLPGNWRWSPSEPEQITCLQCGTVFPNAKYPETVTVQTTWGKPQTFTYVGGEPLETFSYKYGRASFSGTIRGKKVEYISTLAQDAANAYALTGNIGYADVTRQILLRLAEVYPYWLVHAGYGEYADMEPAVAAQNINALPKDETVYPPNKPDRKLHTGYWTAGRASGVGIEGNFVRKVATSYDLTHGVYSKQERELIEKNLLHESMSLLLADKVINNKSMANRAAAGLVGMIINDPELVRFGMEGFFKTVNEWFLPDGSTPESPAYAIMALGGIEGFAQALRGYTDPQGYKDAQGIRYDNFDPYRDTKYRQVWESMFLTLQGDLHYPPFADSYTYSRMDGKFAELMTDNYPENEQYFALLHATLDSDWSKAFAPYAIYYADPSRESRPIPKLHLPSHLFPSLKLGCMRTGKDGSESLLLLSASDWGVHHHRDGLNLYYWKNGRELWSDLGYLWDHPDQEKTVRTLAHNTVLMDEKDQISKGRQGEVRYFLDTANVKAMRAASNAYPNATTYERASTLIDHGNGRNYVVDVFWTEGGATQDYVYHGPNSEWELVNVSAFPNTPDTQPAPNVWERIKAWFGKSQAAEIKQPLQEVELEQAQETLYDLTDLQLVKNLDNTLHGLRWKFPDAREFTVWHVPQKSEQVFVGKGWGQRDHKNSDRSTTLPYVVRRNKGEGRKAFVSVLEEHPAGQPFIQKITQLTVEGSDAVILQIDTSEGRDYVAVSPKAGEISFSTPDGRVETNAALAVLSVQQGKVRFHAVDAGKVRLSAEK